METIQSWQAELALLGENKVVVVAIVVLFVFFLCKLIKDNSSFKNWLLGNKGTGKLLAFVLIATFFLWIFPVFNATALILFAIAVFAIAIWALFSKKSGLN